ncbi:MAG: hypothetical protein EXS13_10375 [Planctomycetes bacterium]|nr:hypothetical protein [Planctomycetota bacterium]
MQNDEPQDEGPTTRSYSSRTGYRMWGGDPRVTNDRDGKAWLSLAVVVGVALAIGTWVALHR